MDAGKTAAFVVLGKAATNFVADKIPFGGSSRLVSAAKKAGVGLALSILGRRFIGQKNADAMLVGAIISPIEELAAGLPVIGPALAPTTVTVLPAPAGAAGYFTPRGVRGYFAPPAMRGFRDANAANDEFYSG